MQATATVKRTHRNQIRIAAIIAMLLAVLGTGAAVAAITWSDDATPSANVSSSAEPTTDANFRFMEMNMLPEAAAVRPMTYEQYRFRAMNMLPEAAPAPIVAFEHWRMLEANALPGDDSPIVAPSSDLGGVPY
jgi:hypothetical protein